MLEAHGFDPFVEAQCAPFYATTIGRQTLTPGTDFRLLLIGYFEGIDAERGIVWRADDSLALRGFLGLGLDEAPPEHSTISRTRLLIDLETYRAVFHGDPPGAGDGRPREGQDDWHRCDDAGGQCGEAAHPARSPRVDPCNAHPSSGALNESLDSSDAIGRTLGLLHDKVRLLRLF